MNKKDDLTNLAADLNVIDYRGKETLDQLESSIRFPSLPNLEKENGFEQKASISMTFIPRNPKSLMTLTNRKSFFMKPIITSWCFTNFQNRTEKLLKSQYVSFLLLLYNLLAEIITNKNIISQLTNY